MNKFFTELKSKCRKLLRGGNDGQSEGTEASASTSSHINEKERDLLLEDLWRYEERDVVVVRMGVPEWWTDINIRPVLMFAYAVYSKVEILSEKVACEMLIKRTVPELPKKLADARIDSLQPSVVHSRYWYWMTVADGAAMDHSAHYHVTFESRRHNPDELRARWAIPLLVVAEEIRYFLPLIDRFKRGDGGRHCYYTLNRKQRCMLQLSARYPINTQCWMVGPKFFFVRYRVFDPVVPSGVIRYCFDVLMRKLDLSTERLETGGVRSVNAEANKKRFQMMVEYFIKMPIRVSGDVEHTIRRARGIPRGSCFTHLIRTMSNFLITWVVSYSVFHKLPRAYRVCNNKCFFVFETDIDLNVNAFSEFAETHFGVIVDLDRSRAKPHIHGLHDLEYCCETDVDDDD